MILLYTSPRTHQLKLTPNMSFKAGTTMVGWVVLMKVMEIFEQVSEQKWVNDHNERGGYIWAETTPLKSTTKDTKQ